MPMELLYTVYSIIQKQHDEDKLECQRTQIKRSGRRTGASKKRKISGGFL